GALVEHFAGRRRFKAEQQVRHRRLAAAALADDGDDRRLLAVDAEREVLQRRHLPLLEEAAAAEDLAHVAQLEERVHHASLLAAAIRAAVRAAVSRNESPRSNVGRLSINNRV